MHVENALVEFVTASEQEYEEVIEEYEEKILVQEEAPEPPTNDFADTPPAQGKSQCITLILNKHWIYIYIYDVHLCYMYFMETTCINIFVLWVLLVQVWVAGMLRIFGSVTCRYSH